MVNNEQVDIESGKDFHNKTTVLLNILLLL